MVGTCNLGPGIPIDIGDRFVMILRIIYGILCDCSSWLYQFLWGMNNGVNNISWFPEIGVEGFKCKIK